MRAFLTLCLVAVAASENLGYNYHPSSGGSGLSSGTSGSYSSGGLSSGSSYSSGGGLSSGAGLSSGGGLSSGVGFSNGGGFSSGGGYSSGGGFSSGGSSGAGGQVVTELNKEFYFHTAPEEEFQVAGNSQSSTTKLKKNLRVVFIKAPENNGLAKAALNVAKQATEDQTAIYVLTKENDVSDLSQQLQHISEVRSSKPEVRFIKYRTAQDALNAQRAIQAQYDALGGSSKSSHEGVAPVLNYASQSQGSSLQGSGSQSVGSLATSHIASSYSSGIVSGPVNSYVPPKSSYLPASV